MNNGTIGRAEIQYDGTWGTICNLAFGAPDAKVICTALGNNQLKSFSYYNILGPVTGYKNPFNI